MAKEIRHFFELKNSNKLKKYLIFSYFSMKKICCRYSLEVPQDWCHSCSNITSKIRVVNVATFELTQDWPYVNVMNSIFTRLIKLFWQSNKIYLWYLRQLVGGRGGGGGRGRGNIFSKHLLYFYFHVEFSEICKTHVQTIFYVPNLRGHIGLACLSVLHLHSVRSG